MEEIEEFEVDSGLSFSFNKEGDLEIKSICNDPSGLALLCFSIISGNITSYILDTLKEELSDEDYKTFIEEISIYLDSLKNNNEDEPLIKPSQLLSARQE